MTTNALERIGKAQPAATAQNISQATAIEQSRAIAEVQAAVTVAQRMPRDMDRATREMRDVCNRLGLANRAFYRVPNRGNGPSVHLARELVRIWGNVDYGVRELRRDDAAGESEVQAFAWDLETNTRSTRTFIVPHARMRSGTRQPLTDLNDVYLNNQNTGARAVRECIFTVIPTWFTDEAESLCQATLARGDGEPLADRVEKALGWFAGKGVKADQLEARLGKKLTRWDEQDVATLLVISQSIGRGEMTVEEEFPPGRVTAEEITGNGKAPAPDPSTGLVLDGSAHPFVWDDAADDGTCASCGGPADADAHGGAS